MATGITPIARRAARTPPSPVEREMVDRYVTDGAFLWHLRGLSVDSPAYHLGALAAVDGRLEAHLDGLRVAGDEGLRACLAALDGAPEPGHVFLAAVLGVERRDLPALARVLDVSAGAPPLSRAFASALGWVPFAEARRILPGLVGRRCPPELHRIGLTACAIQRQDPGPLLAASLFSPDSRLRARALRAAGELGQRDRLRDVQAALAAEDEPCRLEAAWTAALFGDRPAIEVLCDLSRRRGRAGERAAAMAARRMAPDKAAAWARDLAAEAPRASLHAAGALGDPANGAWLVERMRDPAEARLAGFAFTMITGADFKKEKLVARPPAGFRPAPSDDPEDDDVAMDPDEHLLWPDVPAVQAWWSWREGTLRPGTRYLLGKPIEATWLQRVLAEASQPLRAAAAIELSMRAPRAPLFEVRARGSEQRKALGASRAAEERRP